MTGQEPRAILIAALKGGVGKTTVTFHTGMALNRLGYRVGLMDLDYRSPTLPLLFNPAALRLERSAGDRLVPPSPQEGVWVFSMGFIWPSATAILVEDDQAAQDIEHLLSPGVIAWPDLDFLLLDTPPSTSGIIKAALSHKGEGEKGVLLVTHPSRLSLDATMRSLDLLAEYQAPVYGIISNQGTDDHGQPRYDATDEAVAALVTERGLPIFGAIPHSQNLTRHFDTIAQLLLQARPVLLKREEEPKGAAWKQLMDLASKLSRQS